LVLYFISEIWTLVTGTYGSTNVISHLSGFIFGAGLGLTLLKKYKY
jgi:membrane associated rhomboid family serine protease